MGHLTRHKPGNTRVTVKTDGNPEGKGLNGFLLDWYRTEPRGVVVKPQRQVLAEFGRCPVILANLQGERIVTSVADLLPNAFTSSSLPPDAD